MVGTIRPPYWVDPTRRFTATDIGRKRTGGIDLCLSYIRLLHGFMTAPQILYWVYRISVSFSE